MQIIPLEESIRVYEQITVINVNTMFPSSGANEKTRLIDSAGYRCHVMQMMHLIDWVVHIGQINKFSIKRAAFKMMRGCDEWKVKDAIPGGKH